MKNFGRYFAVAIIVGMLLVALLDHFLKPADRGWPKLTPYSEFVGQVNQGQVSEVAVEGKTIKYTLTDRRIYSTYAMDDPGLIDRLIAKNVTFWSVPTDENVPTLYSLLINWFPMLLLIGVWIFFMRQMQRGAGSKRPD